MYMETELTNHQDVAEPDQVASGVAGTGLKNDIDTGIAEHTYSGDHGVVFSYGGYRKIFAPEKNPGGVGVSPGPGQVFSTPKDLSGTDTEHAPAFPETIKKKNRIVIGMGVFSHGGIPPVVQDPAPATPDKGQNESVPGDSTLAAAAPGPDMDKSPGDLVFSIYERQERIADRLNRKIGRLDRRLIRLEERKLEKPEERRRTK